MSSSWPMKVPGSPSRWLSLSIRQRRANRVFVSGVSGVPVLKIKGRREEEKIGTTKLQGLVRPLPRELGHVRQMQQPRGFQGETVQRNSRDNWDQPCRLGSEYQVLE
jgi:hypothetical protein